MHHRKSVTKPPRIRHPNEFQWMKKLKADQSPGWRMRGLRLPNKLLMHYFAPRPDGALDLICRSNVGTRGAPAKPEKWIPAAKLPYVARRRFACRTCLQRAPAPPPEGVLPAPQGLWPKRRRRSDERGREAPPGPIIPGGCAGPEHPRT